MDWILSILMLVGFWMIGNKDNRGNVVMVATQALWILFAFKIDKPGLLLSAVPLFFVFLRNYRKWRRDAWERL